MIHLKKKLIAALLSAQHSEYHVIKFSASSVRSVMPERYVHEKVSNTQIDSKEGFWDTNRA